MKIAVFFLSCRIPYNMQTKRRQLLLLLCFVLMNTKEAFNNYQLLWTISSIQQLLSNISIPNSRQNFFDIGNDKFSLNLFPQQIRIVLIRTKEKREKKRMLTSSFFFRHKYRPR